MYYFETLGKALSIAAHLENEGFGQGDFGLESVIDSFCEDI